MTRWLQAAKKASEPEIKPNLPKKPSVCEVNSVKSVDSELDRVNRAPRSKAASEDLLPTPYGKSAGGRILTYTGQVVSLDAWRELSQWEKHGSNGRRWNGLSQSWERS